jgi:hypothetical protein
MRENSQDKAKLTYHSFYHGLTWRKTTVPEEMNACWPVAGPEGVRQQTLISFGNSPRLEIRGFNAGSQ